MLHAYLGQLIDRGESDLPIAEGVRRFEQYASQLSALEAGLQAGIDSLDRGEGHELDANRLKSDVRKKLAEKGIVE